MPSLLYVLPFLTMVKPPFYLSLNILIITIILVWITALLLLQVRLHLSVLLSVVFVRWNDGLSLCVLPFLTMVKPLLYFSLNVLIYEGPSINSRTNSTIS